MCEGKKKECRCLLPRGNPVVRLHPRRLRRPADRETGSLSLAANGPDEGTRWAGMPPLPEKYVARESAVSRADSVRSGKLPTGRRDSRRRAHATARLATCRRPLCGFAWLSLMIWPTMRGPLSEGIQVGRSAWGLGLGLGALGEG